MKDFRKVLKNKKKSDMVHPFTIVAFLYHNAFLLIIPLLQYIFFRPQGFWELVKQGSTNLLVAAVIVVYVIVKYRNTHIAVHGEKIIEKRGLLFKKQKIIFKDRLFALSVRKNPVMSLFRAVLFCVDAGGKKAAVSEYISKWHKCVQVKDDKYTKRLTLFESFVSAIDSTSVPSIFLLVIPFLRKTAVLIGDSLSKGFYSGINVWSRLMSKLLPPAVAYISAFILLGYAAVLSYEFLRRVNITVRRGGDILEICRGLCLKIRVNYNIREISDFAFEQGVICMVFGIKKAYFITHIDRKLGSGREFVAAFRGKIKMAREIDMDVLRPSRGSLMSFILLPFCLLVLSIITAFFFQYSGRDVAVSFILVTAVPFFLYWILFRIIAFEHTFLIRKGRRTVVGTYSGFRAIQVTIRNEKIDLVSVRQSPVQRLFGSCSVFIYVRNSRHPVVIKRLNYSAVVEFCSESLVF